VAPPLRTPALCCLPAAHGKTRVGLAVMMALARAGRPERMRSLVGAVPYLDTG